MNQLSGPASIGAYSPQAFFAPASITHWIRGGLLGVKPATGDFVAYVDLDSLIVLIVVTSPGPSMAHCS